MTPDDKTIAQIKEKVAPRDLHQIDIGDGDDEYTLLVCAPNKMEWMKYLNDMTSTEEIGKKVLAHESFIMAVTQWPAREELRSFLSEKCGVVTEITSKIGELVGMGAKVRAKKL